MDGGEAESQINQAQPMTQMNEERLIKKLIEKKKRQLGEKDSH